MNITFDLDDKRHQQIELNNNDPIQSTHLISQHEVEIQLTNRKNILNETTPTNDVNQIFSQPIIDHNWESRYYSGHLVVTCGHFVAYTLKRQNGDDIVCVFYKQVDYRSVINPPFTGDIYDLAFSSSDDILLACVDQASHLRVYRIEKNDEPNELQHTLILFIDLQYSNSQSPPTLSWCCFIPDDSEDSDSYTMMSVTHGSHVEVLNVAIASQSCISENMLTLNQIENGRLTYDDNNGNVTCVCFSPDATALGTGTDKGEIKFFSIHFDQPQTCRCLHLWKPHEGRPISSLFFLDDHKNLTQDTQLWRYAVTGCDQNRELKVWSCFNWSCLQIIRFQYSFIDSVFHSTSQLPILKASIDLTSRFLVLSDINRNSIYVLTIYQDAENNRANFSSINAFTSFNSPSLSFAITAANQINHEHTDFVPYGVRMYSIHTKFFQEMLLVFKTNRFMTLNPPEYSDVQNHSMQDGLVEDFRFEPYISHLTNDGLPLLPMTTNLIEPPVGDLINLPPPYSIDDLLTPDSSLTNITGLANGDTARSLLASHDGLTTNSHPTSTMDPLHGLLLGNTTAFDAITTQQQEHRSHTSPSQKQIAATAAATTSPINRFQSSGNTDLDSSRLIINGISQSPYDLADKEVAESMSCSTNYPLPFEALPDDDNDDVDVVFMPIKTITDDEPVNGNQDALLSSQKYSDNSLWSKQSPIKGLNASNRQDIDDYSDPTETSDKDDDSTADEEDLLHTRIKRRSGRSPNSSQLILNNDSLHEIRQLTRVLNELRTRTTNLASESMSQITSDSYNDDKLDHCCQRLEQLTSKVDRLLSFEPSNTIMCTLSSEYSLLYNNASFLGVVSRQSRPSPNSFPLDIVTNNESQTTLSDTHYDRLEAILIEKIQTYVQSAMKSVFEPYREMKDNLHKDLAAKLLSTDNVIRQTITQIFRSKTMVDSLSHAVSNAIQTTMITSYRDTFNQIVIPSFEKAVTNMFQQTNDVFKRGTKEYLQEMIEYGRQQQRSLIQQREQMMSEIRKETTQLNKEFEKKNQELTNVLKHEITQHLTTNLTPLIRETTRSILREETASIFREVLATQKNDINTLFRQTTTLNPTVSRTATPVSTTNVASPSITNTSSPSDTKQQHVLKLIRLNQLNQAFEFVLSASDLSLVLYLCENVRPADLFSIQPCPLQTPVLLSLIQQLAADLTTKQELKYNYLHEALICLDLSHPSARDYSQNILIDLTKKLYEYIQTNPTTPLAKRFQVLFMATRSLIQKIVQQRATPLSSS
ncbi:unnamed protein product [Adineta steineri]|uniref:Enhancer of mRNA-decapping protein 4 WD40 repeat region domain-containing protein n=1 Tax=Adineta steineri TaxID=433720 RepID=A0A814VE13_9BILA|nr:unnamed protein product [Adineta steineri]CAF1189352.1 unnamed protein product [Adineta steineri]